MRDALNVLQDTVAGLNLDNFIVRQQRRASRNTGSRKPGSRSTTKRARSWSTRSRRCHRPRSHGTEEAKRFDLLMFSLELALLKGSKRFDTLKKQLLEIASALEEQTGIPAIAAAAVLIEEIQTDHWWEGVTVPLLELVRLRLRDLVQHIEKGRKAIVYSNFADEIGEGEEVDLPQVGEADFARFKQKARHFLKAHEDHIVLHKLRHGKPLTADRPGRTGEDAARRRHWRSRRHRARPGDKPRVRALRALAGRARPRRRSARRSASSCRPERRPPRRSSSST